MTGMTGFWMFLGLGSFGTWMDGTRVGKCEFYFIKIVGMGIP